MNLPTGWGRNLILGGISILVVNAKWQIAFFLIAFYSKHPNHRWVIDPDEPPPPQENKKSCWWRKWAQMKEVFPVIRTSEAVLAQTPLIPFISLRHLPSPVTGNSYFFPKKLKHKKTVKKLQTDLAIAKQEAAITILELNEKIKTLCEGRPCPRGQYHYPLPHDKHTSAPLSGWCMQIEWQQNQMLGLCLVVSWLRCWSGSVRQHVSWGSPGSMNSRLDFLWPFDRANESAVAEGMSLYAESWTDKHLRNVTG